MNHRAIALGLACLASFVTSGAAAQGLRPSGAAGAGLRTAPAAPSFTLPAPGASAALRQADFIVAVVNSEPVTNNEVRTRAARIAQQMAQQGVALPPGDLLAREVLERLIVEKIQLQLAREAGIRVDDFAVGQAEEGVAKQNSVSVAEMHRRLAADGISKERFREELRNQMLLQRLRERDVQSRVRVSDLDVDQYLREQQSGADASKQEINLGHILVAVPENASPAQVAERQARAQRAADKVRAGEDFAAVASEFSDAAEAKTAGGLLGMRPAERYPELFVSATAQLPVGGIAGPVRSAAGFHVLKVADKTTAGVPTLVTQSHARHILLRTGPQLTESAAAARLADYRRRIVAGQADFAELAREHSQDGSAKQGGDLGWANPGRYVPEFEQAMNALKPGEVSEPLVSRFGVHLIQLVERREAKLTQREQRDMARDTVREKKVEEAFATWVQELRGRAYVEYRDAPQ
ncbi:peptidylprolyl isomerase [Acidovorax carolinensis]|uniref:Chaperone SurA n=1 Tax=Acidovorax carolinensis TaxID=553814 RepID=A0A240TX90_9BURK|nr:peptidylprolyl isomerase [Acidovorax carolinensis]ART49773.1 molecular chaperone SurA [Acidovorax carolinensis]ART53903.1 molecular chaperone SurA [Acidovorax carolinensis]ART60504.1 molecular chaperone SurA [Acidovorax carolinensis]